MHALELRLPISDVDTAYCDRLPGSESKLSTIKDGVRILRVIFSLVKEERPLRFFGIFALFSAMVSLVLGYPIVVEFLETGLVPRFPTAILAASIMIVAVLAFVSGLILDTVTLGRREIKRLHYLSLPSPKTAERHDT